MSCSWYYIENMVSTRSNTSSDPVRRDHRQMEASIQNTMRDDGDLFADDDVFVEVPSSTQEVVEGRASVVNTGALHVDSRSRARAPVAPEGRAPVAIAPVVGGNEDNAQRALVENASVPSTGQEHRVVIELDPYADWP